MPKLELSRLIGSRVRVKPMKATHPQWGTITGIEYQYPFRIEADAIRASTFRVKLEEGGTVTTLGLYFEDLGALLNAPQRVPARVAFALRGSGAQVTT